MPQAQRGLRGTAQKNHVMPCIQSQNEHLLSALQITHFIARHLLQHLNEIACQRRLETSRLITEVNGHVQQLLQILRQFRAAWQIQPLQEIRIRMRQPQKHPLSLRLLLLPQPDHEQERTGDHEEQKHSAQSCGKAAMRGRGRW